MNISKGTRNDVGSCNFCNEPKSVVVWVVSSQVGPTLRFCTNCKSRLIHEFNLASEKLSHGKRAIRMAFEEEILLKDKAKHE